MRHIYQSKTSSVKQIKHVTERDNTQYSLGRDYFSPNAGQLDTSLSTHHLGCVLEQVQYPMKV